MTSRTHALMTASSTFSHRVEFKPQGETVVVRRAMIDTLLGNWSGDHGQPVVLSLAEARAEYRKLRGLGYQPA